MNDKSSKRLMWQWIVGNRYGGADGGAMGKMFRNRESLSDVALLAREAIQNSWDAARTLREMLDCEVPFSVKFRYVDYHGAKRQELTEALGLVELRDRRSHVTQDRLPPGNILERLDDPSAPLRILYVEDWGSHGLSGHPDLKDKSHLFLAMYYLGGSKKQAGSGGSYGFGKSALERASRISSVIAHSTFRPTNDDPITSRLVGFTWWPNHSVKDDWFEGRAMFAVKTQGNGPEAKELFDPYEQAASDRLASALGMAPRDASEDEQLGTSFMVIDPSIEPDELIQELEMWWWPALEDHLFDVTVIDPLGVVKHPKPVGNPFVAPFIPAYHIATGQAKVSDPKKQRLASEKWRSVREIGIAPGALGLVVPDDGSGSAAGEDGELEPIVALIRGPRMVIQYKSYGRRRVPVRGAFVASPEADDLLRDTEPSSHDCWDTNPSNDVTSVATDMAKSVLNRIKGSIKDMVAEIAPPPPPERRSLAHFSSLLAQFLSDKKGPTLPPPTGGEPIELRLPRGSGLEVVGTDQIRLKTHFTVRLTDKAPDDVALVEVSCSVTINEEEGLGRTRCPMKLQPVGRKHGFVMTADGSWKGKITRENLVSFEVETDPYSNMWTTTLAPAVKRLNDWEN